MNNFNFMKHIGYKTISGKYLLGYINLKKDLLYFDQIIYDKQEIIYSLDWFNNDSRDGNGKITELAKFKIKKLESILISNWQIWSF